MLQILLKELDFAQSGPIILYCDNANELHIGSNPCIMNVQSKLKWIVISSKRFAKSTLAPKVKQKISSQKPLLRSNFVMFPRWA